MTSLKQMLSLFPAAWLLVAGPGALFSAQAGTFGPPAPGAAQNLGSILREKPLVLELYSSQACVFCPAADRLFGDLVRTTGLIGLACHVDYFDVKQGSLARSFCSERQSDYMTKLRAGPNYTPQMVVNGRIDVVGYRHEDVFRALREAAAQDDVAAIGIKRGVGGNAFEIAMPAATASGEYAVWLMLYDKPHDVKIAEGGNRGTPMVYMNIVSDLRALEPWDGSAQARTLGLELMDHQAGLIVLAQDAKTGRVVAAGRFDTPRAKTD